MLTRTLSDIHNHSDTVFHSSHYNAATELGDACRSRLWKKCRRMHYTLKSGRITVFRWGNFNTSLYGEARSEKGQLILLLYA